MLVIVVSGHLAPDLVKELEVLGVSGVFGKPFTQNELLSLVGQSVLA